MNDPQYNYYLLFAIISFSADDVYAVIIVRASRHFVFILLAMQLKSDWIIQKST